MRRLLPAALLFALLLPACGGGSSDRGDAGRDTLAAENRAPADTAAPNIRDEPLTPSTLKDPRIAQLSDAEQRVLQDYVSRGIRRDSLENPGTRRSLGGWLDSNLTVGGVIALYHGTEAIKPLPPETLSRPRPSLPAGASREDG